MHDNPLILRIEAAWDQPKPPPRPDNLLSGRYCVELKSSLEFIANKAWRELPLHELRTHEELVMALEPFALSYYLPAFMLGVLTEKLDGESLLFRLTPYPGPSDPEVERVRGSLSRPQQSVVSDFLIHVARSHGYVVFRYDQNFTTWQSAIATFWTSDSR